MNCKFVVAINLVIIAIHRMKINLTPLQITENCITKKTNRKLNKFLIEKLKTVLIHKHDDTGDYSYTAPKAAASVENAGLDFKSLPILSLVE